MGTLEVAYGTTSVLANFDTNLQVLDLPFLRQPYMGAGLPKRRNLHQQRLPFVLLCLRSDQK